MTKHSSQEQTDRKSTERKKDGDEDDDFKAN
jgi:hypothetical protein